MVGLVCLDIVNHCDRYVSLSLSLSLSLASPFSLSLSPVSPSLHPRRDIKALLSPRYPSEDEDIRAKDQRWVTGGNASNSSKVLSLLGRRCEYVGTLGKGMETE